MLGDVGRDPVLAKQWKSVMNQWSRMKAMSDQRINYNFLCGLNETLAGAARIGIID